MHSESGGMQFYIVYNNLWSLDKNFPDLHPIKKKKLRENMDQQMKNHINPSLSQSVEERNKMDRYHFKTLVEFTTDCRLSLHEKIIQGSP